MDDVDDQLLGYLAEALDQYSWQATHWGENMAEKTTTKNPPTLGFLALQEVAWALGLTAMVINATSRGVDWIWIGLLAGWQASIIWGFVKLRRAKTT